MWFAVGVCMALRDRIGSRKKIGVERVFLSLCLTLPITLAGAVHAIAKSENPVEDSTPEAAVPIGPCASAYHDALAGIDKTELPALEQTMKSVNSGWKKLPGDWVFPPIRLSKDKPYRTLIFRASRMIRTRGIDLKLKTHLRHQLLDRLVKDLKIYAGQKPAAALCTGAQNYMNVLEKRLEPLTKRTAKRSVYFERSAQIADWKLVKAKTVLAKAGTAEKKPARRDLKRLASALTTARRLWVTIVDADGSPGRMVDHADRLRAIRAGLKGAKPGRKSALSASWRDLNIALSGLESLLYIQGSHAKHTEIHGAFLATMSAVRSAHRRECSCAN